MTIRRPATPARRAMRCVAVLGVALLLAGACSDDDTDADPNLTAPDLDEVGDDLEDLGDEAAEVGAQAQADLEEALEDAGLTNLATAVSQVDLSDVLADEEFTVFAPDDSAFLGIDSEDLSDLLTDPEGILDLLSNHLVIGEAYTADDLTDLSTVTTEAGVSLTITVVDGTVTVDGASVTRTETVGNGVIHVIDEVLIVRSPS